MPTVAGIDGDTVSAAGAVGDVVTGSFNVPANTLVVVLSHNDTDGVNSTAKTISDNKGLNWATITLPARTEVETNQNTEVWAWAAYCPGAQTGMVITVDQPVTAFSSEVEVLLADGSIWAMSGQPGGVAEGSDNKTGGLVTTASVTATTPGSRSIIAYTHEHSSNSNAPTAGTGTALLSAAGGVVGGSFSYFIGVSDSDWASGAEDLNVVAPAGTIFSKITWVIFELQPTFIPPVVTDVPGGIGTLPLGEHVVGHEFKSFGPPSATPNFSSTGTLSVVVVPQQAFAAGFSSTGTLSLVVVPKQTFAAGFSSVGTLSVSVVPKQAFSAGFSSAGTLSVVAGAPAFVASVGFSSTGTLSTTQIPSVAISANFSSTGTLSTAVVPKQAATAAFSSTGTLSTAVVPKQAATAGFSSEGTLGVVGLNTGTETATFSGTGTLSITGTPSISITANFSSTGTLSTTGKPGASTAAGFSSTGTLTVAVVPRVSVAVGFSSVGTFSTAVVPRVAVSVNFSGVGTLTVFGGTAGQAAVGFSSTGTLSTTQKPGLIVTASFSGTGTLSTQALAGAQGVANFTGSGTLSTAATPGAGAAAAFSALGILSVELVAGITGGAALFSSIGTLSAVGEDLGDQRDLKIVIGPPYTAWGVLIRDSPWKAEVLPSQWAVGPVRT